MNNGQSNAQVNWDQLIENFSTLSNKAMRTRQPLNNILNVHGDREGERKIKGLFSEIKNRCNNNILNITDPWIYQRLTEIMKGCPTLFNCALQGLGPELTRQIFSPVDVIRNTHSINSAASLGYLIGQGIYSAEQLNKSYYEDFEKSERDEIRKKANNSWCDRIGISMNIKKERKIIKKRDFTKKPYPPLNDDEEDYDLDQDSDYNSQDDMSDFSHHSECAPNMNKESSPPYSRGLNDRSYHNDRNKDMTRHHRMRSNHHRNTNIIKKNEESTYSNSSNYSNLPPEIPYHQPYTKKQKLNSNLSTRSVSGNASVDQITLLQKENSQLRSQVNYWHNMFETEREKRARQYRKAVQEINKLRFQLSQKYVNPYHDHSTSNQTLSYQDKMYRMEPRPYINRHQYQQQQYMRGHSTSTMPYPLKQPSSHYRHPRLQEGRGYAAYRPTEHHAAPNIKNKAL